MGTPVEPGPGPLAATSGLLDDLHERAAANPAWTGTLAAFPPGRLPPVSLHLAVLTEPHLDLVLDGQKTVESRFAATRQPPYRRAAAGDIVLLKRTAGPVVGVCRVARVWHYRLDSASWAHLRRVFARPLCASEAFFESRSAAVYATLLRLAEVRPMPPLPTAKRDRRGWVILAARDDPPRLL